MSGAASRGANPTAQGHIPSLDGFRVIATLIVFFSHSGFGFVVPGLFGVTVFFFLSGFLITTLLFREADRTGRIDLPGFFARRAVRLYPALLATMVIGYGLVALGLLAGEVRPEIIASQMLYWFNYYRIYAEGSGEGVAGFRVLWSLSVEEHFYLAYPFVFLALLTVRRPRARLAVLGAGLAAVLAWRIALVTGGDPSYLRMAQATDTRIDSILWGCLLAFWHRGREAPPDAPATEDARGARRMHLVLVLSALVLLVTFAYRDEAFRQTWRYTLQGAALVPVFHYAVTAPRAWWFRPLNWPFVRPLALCTYAFYLIHDAVLHGLTRYGVGPDRPLAHNIAGLALTLALSALLYVAVERPAARLRRTLHGRARRGAASA